MALIKFGMMMTDARGKLGGHVFTKARNGATIRTKVTPSNPQTLAQMTARSIFSGISMAWRLISEEKRLAWNAAVPDFARTNVFGDSYLPSGKNLFTQLNCNLLNVTQPTITEPPTPFGAPSLLLSVAAIDTGSEELTLTYAGDEPGDGFSKVIEATQPFSAGRYNFSGSFRKIFSWDAALEPTPAVAYTRYIDRFGLPATGKKIAFRAFTVNNDTGERSAYSSVTTIVV